MAEQLTFDLPSEPALGRGDFFISPANAVAADAIQSWHDWPQGRLVLVGPPASGKTHLVHVWAAMCGARIVAARELDGADLPALAQGPLAVEDADAVAGEAALEQALFHLHNMMLAGGHGYLLTARTPPARWPVALPDLASRMQGSAVVTLNAPDDALLSAVMVKQFADRQIAIDPPVISYVAARAERSFEAAARLVDALDRAALAEGRAITLPLARRVLGELDKEGPDGR